MPLRYSPKKSKKSPKKSPKKSKKSAGLERMAKRLVKMGKLKNKEDALRIGKIYNDSIVRRKKTINSKEFRDHVRKMYERIQNA